MTVRWSRTFGLETGTATETCGVETLETCSLVSRLTSLVVAVDGGSSGGQDDVRRTDGVSGASCSGHRHVDSVCLPSPSCSHYRSPIQNYRQHIPGSGLTYAGFCHLLSAR